MIDSKGRIFELDFLRGLALVLMCLDHLVYDLACLPLWFPYVDLPWLNALSDFGFDVFTSPWRSALHYVFATLFLLLAGIGSSLTRHPLKRCGQIAAGALVITLGSVALDLWFDLDATILFGVLSVMAVGTFLCFLASLLGKKWGSWIALAAGIAIIAVGFHFRWYAKYDLYSFGWEDLPSVILGTARYGADWFPVFPCAGVVLVGFWLGDLLYSSRQSLLPVLRGKTSLLCKVGQRPLLIYLLHQPGIMAILFVLVFIATKLEAA